MTAIQLCQICEKRRPRRYCPGVNGDICPRCCGEERENSVDCPFDCEYLREARRHERPPDVAREDIPHLDIEITGEFLGANSKLVMHVARSLVDAALAVPGAIDADAREALESMIRTHRTLESGLIYTSRPDNPLAASIQQRVAESTERLRNALKKRTGSNPIRDKDLLGVLVFLARVGVAHDNGRRRGRAFLDFLHQHFEQSPPGETAPLITS